MQKQHQLGKFGTVFARRAEVKDEYRQHYRTTGVLYLDTRQAGPEWDKCPGLRIHGVEYHLSAEVWREEGRDGITRCWFKYYSLTRMGLREPTRNASSAVHTLALELAAQLFSDPLWMAETDVELATKAADKAHARVTELVQELSAAQDAAAAAFDAACEARTRLREMRGNIE